MYDTTSAYLQSELNYRAARIKTSVGARRQRRLHPGTPPGRGEQRALIDERERRRTRHDGPRDGADEPDPGGTGRRAVGACFDARRPS